MKPHYQDQAVWITCVHLFFNALLPLCVGSPHSTFRHFERLKPHHILVRQKRAASGRHRIGLTVFFSAFQRRFTMLLTPSTRVLHPRLQVDLVDNTGKARPYSIHKNRFYSGTLDGDQNHEVDASESGGVWIVHIHTPDDFYAVEPMRFYDRRANLREMIVYRGQDIRTENATDTEPFCEEIPLEQLPKDATGHLEIREESLIDESKAHMRMIYAKDRKPDKTNRGGDAPSSFHRLEFGESEHTTTRSKRYSSRDNDNTAKPTDCDMVVVADYNLYKGIGAENPASIVQTLIHVYKLVDRIFRQTNFGGAFVGDYGIVVRGIVIYTNYSDSMSHHNSPNMSMSAFDVLRAMMHHRPFVEHCLAHMSMQRETGVTLGLATVAQPRESWKFGVCAAEGETFAKNVGLSNVIDKKGDILPLTRYSLVVAHEIGHNWGARHDLVEPPDGKCNPATARGGKFLMWPYSSLGKDPNSHLFSPCSKLSIRAILDARAHSCFLSKEVTSHTCGDGLLGRAEDCDPGYVYLHQDPCCQSNCRLRPGAQCSFRNEPCCTKTCTIAQASQKCYPHGGLQPCYRPSHCLGNDSMTCPQPTSARNKQPCGDGGWCWYGRCMSFCERKGRSQSPPRDLRPCECDCDTTAMCHHCCLDKNVPGAKCQIMGGPLKDGASCVVGVCKGGDCVQNNDTLFLKDTIGSLNMDKRLEATKGRSRSVVARVKTTYLVCVLSFFILDHVLVS